LGTVGWTNYIPNDPERLYSWAGTDGVVFAWEAAANVPVSTAFLTTTALDDGSKGMAFQTFNPADTPGLAFNVDVRPGYDPDNIEARFAVQMNGSNWFCENTPLPVPTVEAASFATYTRNFNAAAANWNTLTLGTSNVTIGAIAPAPLSGLITGAGVVFRHFTDNGTHDFDNFQLTAGVGRLYASLNSGQFALSWFGGSTIRLQRTTNLVSPQWTDVADTLGSNTASVAFAQTEEYYRLAVTNGATTGFANTGFEADGGTTQTPASWSSTGSTSSDMVVAGGAAGGFSLQHSNGTAYVVETSQIVAGLTNGIYKLTGKVKSSGGQKACYLAGNDKITSLPPISDNWADTVVRGISVTNGQCVVRIYSDASASNWCRVDDLQLVRDNIAYEFLKGGDISELPRLEYYGAKFYDNGVEKDCLQILKDHGCNIVRIRMYNDPGNTNYYPANQLDPLGWQNPARTLALCQRAKAMGFKIQLTFHYSDYWTNPGLQTKPHDWEGLTFLQLTNALYTFTRDFMMQLTNVNVFPEYVSIGNEIRGGILFPDGSYTNWNQLATLLKTGYGAVKSVSPDSRVIIHLDKVDAGNVNWFFGNLTSRNVNFDVIGCSYYPFWTDLTSSQARAEIDSWYSNFNKPVMIMETGYNWNPTTCNGSSGQLSDNGPEPYPSTPLGQKNFLLQCFNDLKLVADGHCIGDLYWDPVFICVPGQGWQNGAPNVVGNTTLFDFSGSALPSLDAFQFNN